MSASQLQYLVHFCIFPYHYRQSCVYSKVVRSKELYSAHLVLFCATLFKCLMGIYSASSNLSTYLIPFFKRISLFQAFRKVLTAISGTNLNMTLHYFTTRTKLCVNRGHSLQSDDCLIYSNKLAGF